MTQSAPAFAETNRLGFFAAKDIAEEGFIYGLPIVMNYATMYEFATAPIDGVRYNAVALR